MKIERIEGKLLSEEDGFGGIIKPITELGWTFEEGATVDTEIASMMVTMIFSRPEKIEDYDQIEEEEDKVEKFLQHEADCTEGSVGPNHIEVYYAESLNKLSVEYQINY